MILLIDNYDSFTYNLYQCLGALAPKSDVLILRNDALTLDEIDELAPTRLIVSPGPRTPAESGISVDAIRLLAGRVPILGVCLGHQCIAAAFGATVGQASRLMHGKTSRIHHDGRSLFADLPNPLTAARYHSLSVDADSIPPEFTITARSADDNEIMGMRHRSLPIEGVQFHPESFLTPDGSELMKAFLGMPVSSVVV